MRKVKNILQNFGFFIQILKTIFGNPDYSEKSLYDIENKTKEELVKIAPKLAKACKIMDKTLESYIELEFMIGIYYNASQPIKNPPDSSAFWKQTVPIDEKVIKKIFERFRKAESAIRTLAEVENLLGEK